MQPIDVQAIAGSLFMAFLMFMFTASFMISSTKEPEQIAREKKKKKPFLDIPDIPLPFYMQDEVIVPEPKKSQPKVKPQPKVCQNKINSYSEILRAIGFTSSDSKRIATKLLKQNPNLTQEELLRKATQ